MEGLLEVIPNSFLLSSAFEETIQKSMFGRQWSLFVSLPLKISKILEGEDAVAEAKLRYMCKSQLRNGVPSIYKFVSFLIEAYCSHNNTKINLKDIKDVLHSLGVVKFDKINKWDSSKDQIEYSEDNRTGKSITQIATSKHDTIMKDNKNVFIVHGHDELIKSKVEIVLLKLGLKPIVLSQQPNEGDTIIDKFEKNSSRADYAIILLTADDEGKAKSDDSYNSRARQNVIFEMGYFVARLGRKNICYLYEEGVEIPSDIKGIAYVALERDSWPLDLVKELKKRGFDVSADKL